MEAPISISLHKNRETIIVHMKIGFYKPFIKIYFLDQTEDYNATSYEVVNLFKIFEDHGHECKILSETDLDDEISPLVGTLGETYNRIILFGGPFILNNDNGLIIHKLRELTDRLDYMLTDMRCVPPDEKFYKIFNNFYSQSTLPELFGQENKYGGVAEFRTYKMELPKITLKLLQKKDVDIYFGGTERFRKEKYLDYVMRPNVNMSGYTKSFGYANFNYRMTRPEYFEWLKRTKYSIVFADKQYEENNFITPRFYENVEFSVLNFVDKDWDRDEHVWPKDDFCRVKNYIDWMQKLEKIENDPALYFQLLEKQRQIIKPEYVTGKYVYGLLK
jgi:hypothetical protein